MWSPATGSEPPGSLGGRCWSALSAPIAVGLTFASGHALMRGTEHGWLPCTALFNLTNINPILLLAIDAGALLLVGAYAAAV